MIVAIFLIFSIGLIVIIQFGGKTYFMTADSLELQFSSIDENNIQKVYDFRLGLIPALIGGKQFYNGIQQISCSDKKGNKFKIQVNKHAQIRITQANGKRQSLYIDTMFVRNALTYGNKSHFVKIPIAPIPLKNIQKSSCNFAHQKRRGLNNQGSKAGIKFLC
jgi:hypothetical protein